MAQFFASDFTLFAATVAGLALTTVAILREFPSGLHLRTRMRTSGTGLDGQPRA